MQHTDVVVTPPHAYFSRAHLDEVIDEMKRLGSPRIRAFFDAASGAWFCREGTHRLRAAKALGVAPTMVVVPWWRQISSLSQARHAARIRGHRFDAVMVDSSNRLAWSVDYKATSRTSAVDTNIRANTLGEAVADFVALRSRTGLDYYSVSFEDGPLAGR